MISLTPVHVSITLSMYYCILVCLNVGQTQTPDQVRESRLVRLEVPKESTYIVLFTARQNRERRPIRILGGFILFIFHFIAFPVFPVFPKSFLSTSARCDKGGVMYMYM